MPVTANAPAPYAPASAITDIVSRHRSRGLPSPITMEVLSRAGITDSLVSRTLQALKTLDLIDQDEKPTPTLEALRLVPEADYRERLGEWLNNAYADVLKFVDPATADETALRDAFRSYTPIGQRDRMVSLFIGLYAAAGIGPEKPNGGRSARRPKTPANSNGAGPAATSRRAAPTAGSTFSKPADTSDRPPPPPIHNAIIAANEYQLVSLLDPAMTDDEQKAVWTLIQFLKTKGTKGTSP